MTITANFDQASTSRRSRRRSGFAGVVVTVLAATACASSGPRPDAASERRSAPTAGDGSSYAPAACPNPVVEGMPEDDLGPDFECGFLTVPQNRAHPDGKTIRIPVARRKATSPNPKPDPIVFLAGGPGGSALLEQPAVKGWNVDRDVILVSQRGTLKADPILSCPEIEEFRRDAVGLPSADSTTRAKSATATRACRDRLAGAGWDLSAFNTTENAADIADLRVALGIHEWNVYGASYGVRLALQLLRDHPQGIRTLVLDSLHPSQFNVVQDWPSAAEGYDALFDACAADDACHTAFPDLRAEFEQLVKDLSAHPRTVTVSDPSTGQPVDVVIDGYKLANFVGPGSNEPELLAKVPRLVHQLFSGDGTELATALVPAPGPADVFGRGLTLGVQCGEFVPFATPKEMRATGERALPDFPASVLSLLPQDPHVFSDCRQWDVPRAGRHVTKPPHSTLPVLMASGSLDPITPPSTAKVVAKDLPNSHRLVFPGARHEVATWSQACFATIMTSFLDNPERFDDSCLQSVRVPPFET